MNKPILLAHIRRMILLFVLLLLLSGITAFPIHTELAWFMKQNVFSTDSELGAWLQKVWLGVDDAARRYPFLFYGYDWMAYAHIVIGMAFIGPYRDPVRNKWIIDWGMIACVGAIPLAFIAGPIRGIPLFHILIDCSFGVLGIIPLMVVRRWINRLEQMDGMQTN